MENNHKGDSNAQLDDAQGSPVPIPGSKEPGVNAGKEDMYDLLIDRADDVGGMVAYALYKKAKREAIARFIYDNNCSPTAQDFRSLSIPLEQSIGHYRYRAQHLIRSYNNSIMEEVSRSVIDGIYAKLASRLPEPRPYSTFFLNAAAGACGVLILGALVLLWRAYDILLPTIGQVWNKIAMLVGASG